MSVAIGGVALFKPICFVDVEAAVSRRAALSLKGHEADGRHGLTRSRSLASTTGSIHVTPSVAFWNASLAAVTPGTSVRA